MIQFNDLYFTVDGDFIVNEIGDLKDLDEAAAFDSNTHIKQFILHRLIAEKDAWKLHPNICGGLDSFIGRIINQDLLNQIEMRIKYILTFDGFLNSSEIKVKSINLEAGTEAILLIIYVLGLSSKPIALLSFDIQSGKVSQVR